MKTSNDKIRFNRAMRQHVNDLISYAQEHQGYTSNSWQHNTDKDLFVGINYHINFSVTFSVFCGSGNEMASKESHTVFGFDYHVSVSPDALLDSLTNDFIVIKEMIDRHFKGATRE